MASTTQDMKVDPSSTLTNKIKQLPTQCQMLYNHKATYEISATGAVTFYPSPHLNDTQYGKQIFPKEKFINSQQAKNILTEAESDKFETIYDNDLQILKKMDSENAFLRTVEIAFFHHYGLKIKPSHIWLLIMQSLAKHIELNSKQLRNKYVSTNASKKLKIQIDYFEKGSNNNNWNEIINKFINCIDSNTVNGTIPLLESDFSTTSIVDKIATKICIMDAMKKYYDYEGDAGCGFKSITLDGTKNDWINLKNKTSILLTTKVLQSFGSKWMKAIMPILDKFIDCYDGKIDCLFWNSMLKRGGVELSTGELYSMEEWLGIYDYSQIIKDKSIAKNININDNDNKDDNDNDSDDDCDFACDEIYCGWINVFFPIIENSFNRYCEPYDIKLDYVKNGLDKPGLGPDIEQMPIGISVASMTLNNIPKKEKYQFQVGSGFLGVTQCKDTLQLSPVVGWFVAEKKKNVVKT